MILYILLFGSQQTKPPTFYCYTLTHKHVCAWVNVRLLCQPGGGGTIGIKTPCPVSIRVGYTTGGGGG